MGVRTGLKRSVTLRRPIGGPTIFIGYAEGVSGRSKPWQIGKDSATIEIRNIQNQEISGIRRDFARDWIAPDQKESRGKEQC